MKVLNTIKAMLVISLCSLPAQLLAFWAPGNGNTDGPPNGAWVGPHMGFDWSVILDVLPFI